MSRLLQAIIGDLYLKYNSGNYTRLTNLKLFTKRYIEVS